MNDWNVIVTVREGGFNPIRNLFKRFGPVSRTEFFNVLVLRTDDIPYVMERLREDIAENPEVLSSLARVVPVTRTFDFQTPEEFERKAREIVLDWASELAGKGFHIRMHRRGFKGKLSSWEEERFLDEALLEHLEKLGTPAHIDFKNPDVIIALETIGQRAGFSLWKREDLERYPFLRFDIGLKAATPEIEPVS